MYSCFQSGWEERGEKQYTHTHTHTREGGKIGGRREREGEERKKRGGGREEGNEAGRNRIKDDARKISNTPLVKSTLEKEEQKSSSKHPKG